VKEQNINGDNYRLAISSQPGLGGKDDLNGRVWWDQGFVPLSFAAEKAFH